MVRFPDRPVPFELATLERRAMTFSADDSSLSLEKLKQLKADFDAKQDQLPALPVGIVYRTDVYDSIKQALPSRPAELPPHSIVPVPIVGQAVAIPIHCSRTMPERYKVFYNQISLNAYLTQYP
ncbi:hypothetical protein H6G00_01990 [Leptolyngbya sp. FACHB-541]|uniref:hypothetical protein n=1 Tax=Leptolyngbya sp. FACHB-541 TaxID=2692810 RepID=UPI001686B96F|nr:hypothetical protein [Leptolyngbya sp. FACHB-541]MBD1995403.1 hypothetical protein [Leptolyngbya sp. FACHB-541]